jgi:hypothetical protein
LAAAEALAALGANLAIVGRSKTRTAHCIGSHQGSSREAIGQRPIRA